MPELNPVTNWPYKWPQLRFIMKETWHTVSWYTFALNKSSQFKNLGISTCFQFKFPPFEWIPRIQKSSEFSFSHSGMSPIFHHRSTNADDRVPESLRNTLWAQLLQKLARRSFFSKHCVHIPIIHRLYKLSRTSVDHQSVFVFQVYCTLTKKLQSKCRHS